MAVIGNGIIGHGISEVFAKGGIQVTMIGHREESLQRALQKISESLSTFAEHELLHRSEVATILGRVTTSTEIADAAHADLVIEAVPEDMALKLSIFEKLDEICSTDAVLASSSGHPASVFGARANRRERVVATHFWYPPQLLPLVEICGSPETSRETLQWITNVLRHIGKEPVVIDREIPGFIGNRIQFAALREAWSLWAQGVASAAAIDAVVRNSIGRRLGITGPIESADLGGLATMVRFAEFLQPTLDVAPLPPTALREMVTSAGNGNSRVHPRSEENREDLLRQRTQELIRWLKADSSHRT
nr:3-hydroxyacyl-CoA dehydrogenase family protein [Rhodoligotrophos appendicifer]